MRRVRPGTRRRGKLVEVVTIKKYSGSKSARPRRSTRRVRRRI